MKGVGPGEGRGSVRFIQHSLTHELDGENTRREIFPTVKEKSSFLPRLKMLNGDGNNCDDFYGLYLSSLSVLHQGCLVFNRDATACCAVYLEGH